MAELSPSALIALALDLTNGLNTSDRFDRLLRTIRSTLPADAVVILRRSGTELTPLAQIGLTRDALGRRFQIEDHPRFKQLCQTNQPIRFDADCGLPDPYDGMLLSHDGNLPVHACMGLPLIVQNKLIGLVTLDSMAPRVFDDISQKTLDIISALSAATLKNAILLDQLETLSRHNQQVVAELTNEALEKDGGELIGSSPAMHALKQDIRLVAPSDFTVLIQGESGVGKELVARTLHRESNRASKALVTLNCAAISENLIESELFGHVKGAFTGADQDRAGKFSLANQGTLFLDEVGELPLEAQSKLLRALQNKEIQPVGKDQIIHVDVRVVAATNRDLEHEVKAGRFRADLYHRLTVYPMTVPPLRDRGDDVAELSGFFCEHVRRKLGIQQLTLDHSASQLLAHYPWPGNVRELEHVISRAALKARSLRESAIVTIIASDIEGVDSSAISDTAMVSQSTHIGDHTDSPQALSGESLNLKSETEAFQRRMITHCLQAAQGNWAEAARRLQTDRGNLRRLATRLGIQVTRSIHPNH